MLEFFLFLHSFLTPPKIFAVEPTPTTAQSASTDEIQKIRQAVQKKVEEKLRQIVAPSSAVRSLLGTIIEIKDKQITIEYKNYKQSFQIVDDVIIIDSKRNKAKTDSLKVGQGILAMGKTNESGTLQASRIVFTDLKLVENKKQVVVAQIADLSTLYSATPLFTAIAVNDKNSQYQVKTDTNTKIENNNGQKNTKLTSGQKVIIIIKPDEKSDKTFYASKVIVLK